MAAAVLTAEHGVWEGFRLIFRFFFRHFCTTMVVIYTVTRLRMELFRRKSDQVIGIREKRIVIREWRT